MKRLPLVVVAAALAIAASTTRPPSAGRDRAAETQAIGQQPESDEGVREFLNQLEEAVQSGLTSRYLVLVSATADRMRARAFGDSEILTPATRVVIQERDRRGFVGAAPGTGYRIMLDVFMEFGGHGREVTWQIDIVRENRDRPWGIEDQRRLTSVENLYRITLNTSKQFDAQNLTIHAEDIELTLPHGSVFVAETEQGVTGLVVVGNVQLRFHPAPETEQGQLRIFCGRPALDTRADTVFVRVNPDDFAAHVAGTLTPVAIDQREMRRASDIFREQAPKTFSVDLADLSRDSWSILPSYGDFLAEIHTARHGTLTYAHSGSDAEDISFFNRAARRNISVYTSAQKLARRGRFYNEDDSVDYDILDYDIDLAFAPDRQFLSGRARVHLKSRSSSLTSLTMKLADSLAVQSVVSQEFGRLFSIRITGQNSIVVNLPVPMKKDGELTLTIVYAGRLLPELGDQEAITVDQRGGAQLEDALVPPETSYLYTNQPYWYPQSTVTDYATATVRITIPAPFDCVASGNPAAGTPTITGGQGAAGRKAFVFTASEPVRYLAFLVSRFDRSYGSTKLALGDRNVDLSLDANPRQARRARDDMDRAADVMRFYTSILEDYPYDALTVAVIESDLPGGHSPGYFAVIRQPMSLMPVRRNDPEVFADYPEFFVAHELAHQWWGQAVGWRNYHEQWISEGFAEYFAALYAEHHRGDRVFAGVVDQLRAWGMRESARGPIYLGYRLGQVGDDSRVFSSLVYNKSAAVLHMLRRLVGDEAFFAGVRRFYKESRFSKAGTEDFRRAMEAEAHQPLERFFERWIYGSTLPKLQFSFKEAGGDVVLHVEQRGELFDVPLTVTLRYADRRSKDVTIPVTDRSVDMRVKLEGTLRGVDIKNDGTLADIVKR